MKRLYPFLFAILWAGCTETPPAQLPEIEMDAFNDGIHHWNMEHPERDYVRLKSTQVREIAANLMAYQNEDGGWPKNIDWLAVLDVDSVKASLSPRYRESTLDNRNTFPQIDYLAKTYWASDDEQYLKAAERGIRYILNTQNASGGWRGWDVDAITFNDDVMTGAMELLYRVGNYDTPFTWVSHELAAEAKTAFERALDVTLRCQVVIDGVKTAWCQQHDHTTLAPVGARAYELPCVTAHESSSVVAFLMSISDPDDRVVEAVMSAMRWFNQSTLKGIRVEKIEIAPEEMTNHEYPFDKVVVKDPEAPQIWARFYELSDGRTPFMANRDGIKVHQLSDVLPERRMGYAWYGYWPEKVIRAYPEWLARNGLGE